MSALSAAGPGITPALIEAIRKIVGLQRATATPEDCVCYAYDATGLSAVPGMVISARTAEEISAVLRLANREGIPVVPRGAGSGMSGGSVPSCGGIVLDLAKMDRIIEIDRINLAAVVQPGVITATLQAEVEKVGLFYPPDPASLKQSTIGGNIAECAGGPRCLKYGTTKDYVLGLEVVLPTGEIIRTGGKAIKNVTGYNLSQLIVGSEGTLGVVTEATLRLIPKPKAKRTVMAVFPRIDNASQAVTDIIAAGIVPATLEIMGDTAIKCVGAYLHIGLPLDVEAILLIDVDGEEILLGKQVEEIAAVCREDGATDIKVAQSDAEGDLLWRARRSINGALGRMRPNRINEDVSVPRSSIPALVRRVKEIAVRYDLMIALYGHAGDGNLHPNMLCDRRNAEEMHRVHEAGAEIARAAVELGGTLSGEHGIGISKKGYLTLALQPEAIAAMKAVKRALDPNNILNPGKIFTED